jgi:thiol-disulfide isomerase/thioredoxin
MNMKKILLLIYLLIAGTSVYSQEILKVDFETVPAGFKTFNLDGLQDDCGTPGEFSKGWLLSTAMGFSAGSGKYAKDCSDHGNNSTSKADDWIVCRGVKVASSSVIVSWVNFSEWDQNIMLYASKKFNGTAADLSKFTLMATEFNGAWTFNTHTASLNGLSLVPGDSLYVAFRNNVAHKGQFYMDNLVISEAAGRDGGVGTYDSKLYSTANAVPLKGKIYNYGASPINSYTLNWTVNGGAVKTQTFSGLNIATSKYHFFQATGNVNYDQGDNILKMYVSNINGTGAFDDNKKNDTLVEHVYIINSPSVTKNVLIGDYTGTWCGNCVDAFPIIDSLVKNNSRFIAVAMHVQSDPMTTTQTSSFITKYNISGFPTMTYDMRAFDPDDISPGILGGGWPCTEWRNKAAESLSEISPVEVSVTYSINPSTRLLTATVNANFKDAGAFGDLRMNCYVIESPVTGASTNNPTTSYDQTNYRDVVKGHPFYGLGDHIKGYKHQHVFRNALGGIDGTPGVIPSLVTKGQTFQKQYTYQVPATYNINNIHVVGFVSRYNTNNLYNPIYNANDHAIITGLDVASVDPDILVYPNPAQEQITVNIKGTGKISICNSLAQEVSSQNFNTGPGGNITINTSGLQTGIYFLKITCDNRISTKKISIQNP